MSSRKSSKPVFRVVAKRTVCVFPKLLYRNKRIINQRLPLSYPLFRRLQGFRLNNQKLVDMNKELLEDLKHARIEKEILYRELLFHSNQVSKSSQKKQGRRIPEHRIESLQNQFVEAQKQANAFALLLESMRLELNLFQDTPSSPDSGQEPSPPTTSTGTVLAPAGRFIMNEEEKENARFASFFTKAANFNLKYGKLTPVTEMSYASDHARLSDVTNCSTVKKKLEARRHSVSFSAPTSPRTTPKEPANIRSCQPRNSLSPDPFNCTPSIFNFEPVFRSTTTYPRSTSLSDESTTLYDGAFECASSLGRPSFFNDESFLQRIDATAHKNRRSDLNNSEIPTPGSSAYRRSSGSLNCSLGGDTSYMPKLSLQADDTLMRQLGNMNINDQRKKSSRAFGSSIRRTSVLEDNSEMYTTITSSPSSVPDLVPAVESRPAKRTGLRRRKKIVSYKI